MADIKTLENALIAADRAGDTEAAQILADEIRKVRAAKTDQPKGNTLSDRARDIFGFDESLKRGNILPLARNKEDELVFATPQIGVDIAKSLILPGHVAKGGDYTEEDVTRMALDVNPMGKAPGAASRLSKRGFIRSAPERDLLKTQARGLYAKAKARGVVVSSDAFMDMMTKLENKINNFGTSKTLSPTATGVLDEWVKHIGKDMPLERMTILREEALEVSKKAAAGSRESAIANIMLDSVDDLLDNLKPRDLVSGDGRDVGDILRGARRIWSRNKKVQTIEEIMEKAENAASGLENGIRVGFRQLLNNPKKARWFNDHEIKAMKNAVRGGPMRSTLRMLSHLGPGVGRSNRLLGSTIGGSAGAAVGSATGGYVGAGIGAAAVPAAGHVAGRAALRQTRMAAEMAKALAATGYKPNFNAGRYSLIRRTPGLMLGTQFDDNGLAPLLD